MNTKIKTSIIIGIAIIITAYILGNAFKNRNENLDTISVVGLGTKNFVSDEILWTCSFSAKKATIKEAYNKITSNQKIITNFFIKKGFSTEEFSFGAIRFTKEYKEIRIENLDNSYNVKYERIFDGYTASQNITFSATKQPQLMQKIETVSSVTSELINEGIELYSNPIQYSYSSLPSLKHSLIESATIDAKQRAEKISTSGNGNIGKLKKASMGVFQITGQGSTEDYSYGGVYDRYSKNKTARITVRLTYQLD